MNEQRFTLLSGVELTSAQSARYTYVYNKALAQLEYLLGWKLNQKSLFEEAGKTSSECIKINQTMNEAAYTVFKNGLQPADEAQGDYRLFPYSNLDTNLKIDPTTAIYQVKLVTFPRGSDQEFVTLKTFKNWQANYGYPAFVNGSQRYFADYVQLCSDDVGLECGNCCRGCTGCGYLAIDGDWIKGTLPEDLENLLVELIVQGYKYPYSLNASNDRLVQSESVENHSVTYVVTNAEKEGTASLKSRVQDEGWFLDTIKLWIGPYSPLYKHIRPKVY